MKKGSSQLEYGSAGRGRQLQMAALALFTPSADAAVEQLSAFSERDWRRCYAWVDASGMALYLLDRLKELGASSAIPPAILARFEVNHADNSARTEALFREAAELSEDFSRAGIKYAVLKGATLSPSSVPDLSLRCQLDLDFLVSPFTVSTAQALLERKGYLLHARSGDTLEFKAGSSRVASVRDLYKPKLQRSAELHIENDARQGQLKRAEARRIRGHSLMSLGGADLFLDQALHLFGHLCGEFTRASWVLEYARHIRARYGDESFWGDVQRLASHVPQADLKVGVATLLVREVFGVDAPPVLRRWTIDCLPAEARLWVALYGSAVLTTEYPGSKLYLLLQEALHSPSDEYAPTLRGRLLPQLKTPPVTHGFRGEGFVSRATRQLAQWRYLSFRLRFHLVEGLRYGIESSRWRRRTADILSS